MFARIHILSIPSGPEDQKCSSDGSLELVGSGGSSAVAETDLKKCIENGYEGLNTLVF